MNSVLQEGKEEILKPFQTYLAAHSISFLKQLMLWKVKPNSLTC